MARLAVMALLAVTRGAVRGVPISGASGAYLTGQLTCPVHVSPGAARSEPHRYPRPVVRGVQCSYVYRYRVRVVQGVPGVQGCRVVPRCARNTGVDECIYGVP